MLMRDRLVPSLAHQTFELYKGSSHSSFVLHEGLHVEREIVLTVVNCVKTISEAVMLFHVSYFLNRAINELTVFKLVGNEAMDFLFFSVQDILVSSVPAPKVCEMAIFYYLLRNKNS